MVEAERTQRSWRSWRRIFWPRMEGREDVWWSLLRRGLAERMEAKRRRAVCSGLSCVAVAVGEVSTRSWGWELLDGSRRPSSGSSEVAEEDEEEETASNLACIARAPERSSETLECRMAMTMG